MAHPARLVLLGADGMLGSDFRAAAESAHGSALVCLNRPDFDIGDARCLYRLDSLRPIDAIVNCAAFTDVDRCEDEEETAFTINAVGPGRLAEYCRENGIYLLHISTDYVFDGSKSEPYVEDDIPHPMSAYGRSKLEGEKLIREASPDCAILRSQWLYGRHGKNFVRTMLELGAAGERVRVVDDQRGCPTNTRDLAAWMLKTLDRRLTGVYHAVNSDDCSWHEFARKIFDLRGIQTAIEPVLSSEVRRAAPRPKDSRLANGKLARALGITIRPWDAALAEYLDELS